MKTTATDDFSRDELNDLAEVSRWVTEHCHPEVGLLQMGMDTVEILKSLEMDAQGLVVGLLQPLLPIAEPLQAMLVERFGTLTMTLLRGVGRMQQLSALSQYDTGLPQPKVNEENLRKMLLVMVDDVRVVLIELARHLSVLQRCKQAEQAQQAALGRLTLEVYAPLANRLGIRQLKWQLEDYALRYLAPEEYWNLTALLDEKRVTREKYIREFIQMIQDALAETGLESEVHGRPKHLYSIWKKMQQKGLAFENLQDIQAVRILVNTVADCYSALAIISARWHRLADEFDDYIATPKENNYRSIHTVLIGPHDKHVEVQIRTHEMHQQSEFGVAAHWRYKEHVHADERIDRKILWLRQLLQWKEELQDNNALVENFSRDAEEERVYVFTPKGTVLELPNGSTPIDFAYAIHSEVGHCARGAKVNGKMVPLGYRLATGDQVHIQNAKGGQPSRDWLRNDLGYARTRRARNRIAQWFKQVDHARHLAEGRNMLERELARLGMEHLGYDKITRKTNFHTTDDMLAALGANDFKVSKALAPFRRPNHLPEQSIPLKRPRTTHRSPSNLQVDGVPDLLTRMANCCNPIPGDAVIGFITAGRGVSIHRQNCANMRTLEAHRRDRVVEVQWGDADVASASYVVEIHITAYQHDGLLNELTQFLLKEKIEVLKLNMNTDTENISHIQLRLEISDRQKLDFILNKLSRIPNVLHVKRVTA